MIGTIIGNFKLTAQLGRGGMGEVYAAEHMTIGTKVAVKLLRAEISGDTEQVERFFNEAKIVSKIKHAGIVRIFDVGFASGRAYLIMELLEGEALSKRVADRGRMSATQIADLGRQIASVLDSTHRAEIVHRDLKPDNVFLVRDDDLGQRERVKILDFGIAKLANLGMTSTSMSAMGSPLYMAPEQWRSAAKVDWRADAYALGCLLFEMACGRPPFPATSIAEACACHMHDEPPSARALYPDVPPVLDAMIRRLLSKQPSARAASMSAIATELAAMDNGYDPLAATVGADAWQPVVTPWPQPTPLLGGRGVHNPAAPVQQEMGLTFDSRATALATSVPDASPARAVAVGAPIVGRVEPAARVAYVSQTTLGGSSAEMRVAARRRPRPNLVVISSIVGITLVGIVVVLVLPSQGQTNEEGSPSVAAAKETRSGSSIIVSPLPPSEPEAHPVTAEPPSSSTEAPLSSTSTRVVRESVPAVPRTSSAAHHNARSIAPGMPDPAPSDHGQAGQAQTVPNSTPQQPVAATSGTLAISSKPPCEIYIDGKALGLRTPQAAIVLPAGRHHVQLVNASPSIKESFYVEILAGKMTKQVMDYTVRSPRGEGSVIAKPRPSDKNTTTINPFKRKTQP